MHHNLNKQMYSTYRKRSPFWTTNYIFTRLLTKQKLRSGLQPRSL